MNGRTTYPVPGGPITWSTTGPPPSTYLETPGLLSAKCVNDGPRGYLSVRVNANPADARTDTITGDVVAGGQVLADWGLHLIDMPVAMGDLLRLADSQAAAWLSKQAAK